MKVIKTTLLCLIYTCTFFTVSCKEHTNIENTIAETEMMGENNDFIMLNKNVLSPSQKYFAAFTEEQDGEVKTASVTITSTDNDDETFTCSIKFRQRDTNLVIWSDKEDVLWAYSGDVGLMFITKEADGWIENWYIRGKDNNEHEPPSLLVEKRPKHFH